MQLSFFTLPNSNDVICFCPSFAIPMRVECPGAFERSAFSREFELTLKYTSKFASRDLLSIQMNAKRRRTRRTKIRDKDTTQERLEWK